MGLSAEILQSFTKEFMVLSAKPKPPKLQSRIPALETETARSRAQAEDPKPETLNPPTDTSPYSSPKTLILVTLKEALRRNPQRSPEKNP